MATRESGYASTSCRRTNELVMHEKTCSNSNATSNTGSCVLEATQPPIEGFSSEMKPGIKSQCRDNDTVLYSLEGAENFETKKCCASKAGNANPTKCCSDHKGSMDNEKKSATCCSNSCSAPETQGSVEAVESKSVAQCCTSKAGNTNPTSSCCKNNTSDHHNEKNSTCCTGGDEKNGCCSKDSSEPSEKSNIKLDCNCNAKDLYNDEGTENVETKNCGKAADATPTGCCSKHKGSVNCEERDAQGCCANKVGVAGENQSPNYSTCCAKSVDPRTVARDSAPRTCCIDTENECSTKSKDASCCAEDCEKECCAIALHLVPGFVANSTSKTQRSTFYVQELCCASEIAAIRSILEPLVGVASVRINATVKTVYVDHDLDVIQASDICDALNRDRFGARIEKDAALEAQAASSFVTSILVLTDQETPNHEMIEDFLSNFDPGTLQSSTVDVCGMRVTLVHNSLLMSAEQFVQALSDSLGVHAKVLKDGADTLEWDFKDLSHDQREQDQALAPLHSSLRLNVALSGILWIVSMLSFIGGNWEYLEYVALLSVAFGLPPIAMKGAASLRGCRFDVNCLMTFAAVGSVALQDFTEAAAVTFLFALSEWLELRATSRARNALSAIVQLRPEHANLIHPKSGEIVIVPVGVVPVGALVSVKAGDKIPCDGVVMEGHSTIDESSLTGESRPVRKGPGDSVSGGTINSGNTQMTIRTTVSAEDSAVARLIRLVEEAQANRSNTERIVDDFASIYTPMMVFAAITMCTIPWGWGPDVGAKWTELGLVLIVIACPCALIISTPVTYVAGLAATAQQGVLIKGGAHLEALGMVKTVCFDKTGTLTQGKFQILHFEVIGTKLSRTGALEYLSLMEDRASHPLARALVEGAEKEGVKVPQGRFVRNHTFLPGEGISGTIDGVAIHVGNQRLLERLGLYSTLPDSVQKRVCEWGKIGTVGFMSVNANDVVCMYCVADAIRPEAKQVLQDLKMLGIHAMMVTGDKTETAISIGVTIGVAVNDIRSELLPEEKLAIVSEMKGESSGMRSAFANLCTSRSLVLMCGDGVNDAPALAAADIGVAVAGSALAMETAHVTLMDSKLTKLPYSIKMGRRVIRKIKENVMFSLIVKFLVLGFALAGRAALWAAIASDVGAMLLVTLNSMLLLPAKSKGTTSAETADTGKISLASHNHEKEAEDIEQA